MFGTSWRVAKIFGIDVRVDSSWVVIALLITYSMYLRFSFLYKDLSTAAAVGIVILAAVLFFGSVLVHELAHELVPRARVIRNARCADPSLDADHWFPVSVEADRARQEAAAAIAICSTCMVRAQCLALSLRDWDAGQHGVWGGLVAAERAALRRRS